MSQAVSKMQFEHRPLCCEVVKNQWFAEVVFVDILF